MLTFLGVHTAFPSVGLAPFRIGPHDMLQSLQHMLFPNSLVMSLLLSASYLLCSLYARPIIALHADETKQRVTACTQNVLLVHVYWSSYNLLWKPLNSIVDNSIAESITNKSIFWYGDSSAMQTASAVTNVMPHPQIQSSRPLLKTKVFGWPDWPYFIPSIFLKRKSAMLVNNSVLCFYMVLHEWHMIQVWECTQLCMLSLHRNTTLSTYYGLVVTCTSVTEWKHVYEWRMASFG